MNIELGKLKAYDGISSLMAIANAEKIKLISERKNILEKFQILEKTASEKILGIKKTLEETKNSYQELEKQKASIEYRRNSIKTLPNKLQAKANLEINLFEKNLTHQFKDLTEIDSTKSEEQINEINNLLTAKKNEITNRLSEIEFNLEKIEERIKKYHLEKIEIASEISEPTFNIYKKAINRSPNNPIVAISGTSCLGCFIDIGKQLQSKVLEAEEITTCRACGRILFFA